MFNHSALSLKGRHYIMENVDGINPRKEALLELIHIATQHIYCRQWFSLPRHLCGCWFSCLQLWLSPLYVKTVHWLLSEQHLCYAGTWKSLTSSIKTHILIIRLIAFTFSKSICDGDIKFKLCWLEQGWHDHSHVRQRLLTQAFAQPHA